MTDGRTLVVADVLATSDPQVAEVRAEVAAEAGPDAARLTADALHLACHEAVGRGFSNVVLREELPGARRVGFRPASGAWRVDAPLP